MSQYTKPQIMMTVTMTTTAIADPRRPSDAMRTSSNVATTVRLQVMVKIQPMAGRALRHALVSRESKS